MAYYKCGSVYTTQNSNVVVDTASGAVANFQTPLAMPLKSLTIGVNAKQDLHGYDHPWPAGGGKNIFSPESPVIVGYIGSSGFSTGNTKSRSTYLKIKPNTTYTVSRIIGQRFVLATSEIIPTNGAPYTNYKLKHDASSITITSGNDDEYLWIYFYLEDTDTDPESKVFASIQVELGSTATSWVPYENICPIEGVSEINGVHCHKNLFNLDYLTASGITIQDGEVIGTAQTFYDNFGTKTEGLKQLKFKPNTAYTLSLKAYTDGSYSTSGQGIYFRINYTDGTYVSLAINNNQQEYGEFARTTSASKTIDRIYIIYSSGYSNTWHLKDIQLEEGATATDYEPYSGNKYIIDLGGTYYGGHFTQDNKGHRQFEVNIVFETFIGEDSENWYYYAVDTGSLFRIGVNDRKSGYITQTMANANSYLCNQATKASNNTSGRINGTFSGSGHNLDVINNNFTDLASWKTYLASNPLQFKYELETPIIIDLPDGEPIKSLPGVNNIFADTGDTSLQFRKIG